MEEEFNNNEVNNNIDNNAINEVNIGIDNTDNNNEVNDAPKKKNKFGGFIIIILTLVVMSGVVYYLYNYTNLFNNNNTPEENTTVVTKKYSQEVQNWMQDAKSQLVITVLASTSCPHCIEYKPVITRIAEEKNIKLYIFDIDKISDDDFGAITKEYNTNFNNSVPYTYITNNDTYVADHLGYSTEEEILEFLNNNIQNY